MPKSITSGFLRRCGRRSRQGAELGFIEREPAPVPLHHGVSMHQWLNFVPMASTLLNLAAAMTNLTATIINRRRATSDRADNDTAC